MTYLAFDPNQLQALTMRARLVLVELASLPTGDPAAAEADRIVRSVMRTIELGLLPAVRRVLDAAPLRAPVDARADLDALPSALARRMAVEHGWAVAVDPMADDPTRITPEEVDALAVRLRDTEPRSVLEDPAMSAWLVGELTAIAADPVLARRFTLHFGGWRRWADQLTEDHTYLTRTTSDATSVHAPPLQRVDAVLSAFAAVAAATIDVTEHDERPLAMLDTLDPYEAALLLSSMHLPDAVFVDVALRVLRRGPDPLDGVGPSTADLVLQATLRHPAALPRFATLAVTGTDLLATTLWDHTLLARMLTTATDPRWADEATVGDVLVPVLHAAHDGRAPQLRATDLADLIAPWTPQFLAADHRWGLSGVERSRMLADVLQSTEAVQRLIQRSDAVVAGATRIYGTGTARSVTEYINYLGTMGVIVMDERIRTVQERARAWDAVCQLAGLATSFIPWAAVGLAVTAAVVVIHNQATPDVKAAQTASLFMADAALTQAGATVVSTMFEEYRSIGRIPADAEPPPMANPNSGDATSADYLWRFLDWEETLPGGEDGPIATNIRFSLFSVISPSQIGEHTWWIANGFPGT